MLEAGCVMSSRLGRVLVLALLVGLHAFAAANAGVLASNADT
jgi:hypothetical protein